MWYNLNTNKLAILLNPIILRKSKTIAYLASLVKPLSDSFYLWQQFRADNLYRLNHNGQICYLRKVLNDKFDPELRRIYIADGNKYKRKYIYTVPEKKPVYLGVMYLRQDSDYADTGVDFIVIVPPELLDNDNYEMKALVNYYKLASKRYKIETIE